MDRIAVISDIHGNIPALEAVLKDIAARGIEHIICIGDIIGKGPQPELAVDRVREKCETVVMGNWELGVLMPEDSPEDFLHVIHWNRDKLGAERLDYLQQLPHSVEFLMSGRLIRLFHSSAKGIFHRVHQQHPIEERLAMFDNTPLTGKGPKDRQPDVIGYGDIHGAYLQHLGGKMLFNTGSVGNPLEIPQSVYCILEGHYGSPEHSPFGLQFVRAPYDTELAIKIAEQEVGMPGLEEYIIELRTARYARKK